MSFVGASQSVNRGDVVELLALLEELRAKKKPGEQVQHEEIKQAVQERWAGR